MTNLRLELFTHNLQAALDFYRRVLRFEQEAERPGGYIPLVSGYARLALNRHSDLDQRHPVRSAGRERCGLGVELVLECRPWGLTDFRVLDPDGYYWRITSRT